MDNKIQETGNYGRNNGYHIRPEFMTQLVMPKVQGHRRYGNDEQKQIVSFSEGITFTPLSFATFSNSFLLQ
jgi:hypothetical protein